MFITDIPFLIASFFSGDIFAVKDATQSPALWTVTLILLLAVSLGLQIIYRKYILIERHLERYIMIISYLSIGAIIFVEVIRRFVFNLQAPWSTTLPPYLFLIMAWFGCSYNVKLRTHLGFAEVRSNLPRHLQYALLWLDGILWIGFSWIVVTTSTKVIINSIANFQILLGTDSVMQWWFLMAIPLAFICLVARVIENLIIDVKNYRSGEVLIKQVAIGSGE
ncbi:MAG: TRAP transporter small permease subunit [Alphaproteobacteria bacterium]|nr:TRAP transporter small permease subunit [Alphaproteobacteria bacterium]